MQERKGQNEKEEGVENQGREQEKEEIRVAFSFWHAQPPLRVYSGFDHMPGLGAEASFVHSETQCILEFQQ